MDFLLGTHEPSWLSRSLVPLFISAVRLRIRKAPRAICKWALDSGGFSELSLRGAWTIPVEQYLDEVLRWIEQIGPLEWAAIQDWMCEPWILEKTGKTVEEHQRLTIQSLVDLRDRAPQVRWAPVVQGWRVADYLRHVEMYAQAGVDLGAEPIAALRSHKNRPLTDIELNVLAGLMLLEALPATPARAELASVSMKELLHRGIVSDAAPLGRDVEERIAA